VSPGEPRVTVVVPTRNVIRTIRACLASVRAQDYPGIELVVVDNASTDGTFEVAAELADLAVRGGPERSAQRNRGVELATGDWVLWIDSDMVLAPDVVRLAVRTALDSGAVAVSVPEVSIGPGFWTACRALERCCYQDDPSLANPRLLDRGYLAELGGFDTTMSGPEDTDLRLRLRAAGASVAYCSGALIWHDEGRLTFRTILAKRIYYGRSLPSFAAAHPGALRQQGAGTVRAFLRHRRRLLSDPAHFAGILVMRLSEAVAYGTGAWLGRRARRRSARPGPSGGGTGAGAVGDR
jgi:glycosyltransferase involved in cell wall biosynthesis